MLHQLAKGAIVISYFKLVKIVTSYFELVKSLAMYSQLVALPYSYFFCAAVLFL